MYLKMICVSMVLLGVLATSFAVSYNPWYGPQGSGQRGGPGPYGNQNGMNRGQPGRPGGPYNNGHNQNGQCGPHSMLPESCWEYVNRVLGEYRDMMDDGREPMFLKSSKCKNNRMSHECCQEGMKQAVTRVRLDEINMYDCKDELELIFPLPGDD